MKLYTTGKQHLKSLKRLKFQVDESGYITVDYPKSLVSKVTEVVKKKGV